MLWQPLLSTLIWRIILILQEILFNHLLSKWLRSIISSLRKLKSGFNKISLVRLLFNSKWLALSKIKSVKIFSESTLSMPEDMCIQGCQKSIRRKWLSSMLISVRNLQLSEALLSVSVTLRVFCVCQRHMPRSTSETMWEQMILIRQSICFLSPSFSHKRPLLLDNSERSLSLTSQRELTVISCYYTLLVTLQKKRHFMRKLCAE